MERILRFRFQNLNNMGQCIQKMKTDKCMMDYSEISYEQFIIDVYNKKMNYKR
ncbi:MAG: hypothetical protein LBG80_13585 [Bacteroidales bacterium]|jgi:hypothetical protein|nr:hypothetical protein [Bacteroidales bacterium]